MNTVVALVTYDQGRAERRLARAARWLRAYEDRFSRFRPLSELSRLNAAAGRPFRASPALFALVEAGLAFARRSGGLFDPTVLRSLEAAGYDRSFELVSAGQRSERRWTKGACWQDVRLDSAARTITLPEGAGIDLGGIGKGWAIDRLASILGRPCLVNGGGDVFAAGSPDDAPAWFVGVEDPLATERDLAVLAVTDRGVATSTSLRRRWFNGEARAHHLIDPRTGRPSRSDAIQVTVVAPTTLLADYHAKVALLQGGAGGLRYLNSEPGTEGLVVTRDGAVRATDGIEEYVLEPRSW